jgi:hypothetical protein
LNLIRKHALQKKVLYDMLEKTGLLVTYFPIFLIFYKGESPLTLTGIIYLIISLVLIVEYFQLHSIIKLNASNSEAAVEHNDSTLPWFTIIVVSATAPMIFAWGMTLYYVVVYGALQFNTNADFIVFVAGIILTFGLNIIKQRKKIKALISEEYNTARG